MKDPSDLSTGRSPSAGTQAPGEACDPSAKIEAEGNGAGPIQRDVERAPLALAFFLSFSTRATPHIGSAGVCLS